MSLLKALGIDKYTTRFKQWIASKYVAKDNLKTINGESLEGEGNIEISGGGSSVNADWNAQEGEDGYIKNKPFEEKIVDNLGRIYYAGGEYIDGDYHIKLGNITPRYDEYSGYTFPNFHLTGYLGYIDEETGNDHFVNIISLAGQYPIYKYDSIPDDEDIPYTIYLKETTEFDNYDVYLKTRLGEIKYDLVCNIVEISTLNESFIPDTIARKSDLNTNTNTVKNITIDFGITIVDLLGDYEDYYTFWEYVTQGYNTINYNNDENTIAFPISKREDSEILGERMYIPYPDGQIEIYYSDGSSLGGKIIKTFVDPIVYKYLCNPIILGNDIHIPLELIDEDAVEFKYKISGIYKLRIYNSDINDFIIYNCTHYDDEEQALFASVGNEQSYRICIIRNIEWDDEMPDYYKYIVQVDNYV